MKKARDTSWLLAAFFAATSIVGVLWATATPVMNVPDEPDHVRRAAGVVRGQLLGTSSGQRDGLPVYRVRIPESLGVLGACVFGDFPPECKAMRAHGRGDVLIDVESRLARYNPTYYALVGLPTLVSPGKRTVYLMRWVTVMLVAMLITLGVAVLLDTPAPSRWTLVGLAVATTPMTFFFAGSVNPSAVEIAAGIGLWLGLLGWFSHPAPELGARNALRVAIVGVALVTVRALGPMLLVLIALGAAGASPREAVRLAVRGKPFRLAASIVALAGVVAVGWTIYAGTLDKPDEAFPQYEDAGRFLFDVFKALTSYERQMIGVFGWVDTPAPEHVYVIWFALLGFLVLGAFVVGALRVRMVLLLLLLASATIPVVLQYSVAPELGLIWQGRYLLPLMVGLPLVAGAALSASKKWNYTFAGTFPFAVVLALVGVAQVACFWWALHRNVIGYGGPWIGFTPLWQPPLGWITLTLLYVPAIGAWLWIVGRLALQSGESESSVSFDVRSVEAAADERPEHA